MKFFNIFCINCLFIFLLSSCRSTGSSINLPNSSPKNVEDILSKRDQYLNKNVYISGIVKEVKLKKIDRDDRLVLEIKIEDYRDFEMDENYSPNLISYRMDLATEKLELITMQPILELSGGTNLKSMEYDLKREANRIYALSNYFKSLDKKIELSNSIEKIAKGYLKISEAYSTFSNIEVLKFELEEPFNIESEELKLGDENEFENSLLDLGKYFILISEELVDIRNDIIDQETDFCYKDIQLTVGYKAILVGDLLEGKSWDYKKDENVEEDYYKEMSQGFRKLGEGINEIFSGFYELGEKLDDKQDPIVFESQYFLKCIYIGDNKEVIKDVKEKAELVRDGPPITVYGKLNKGNLREELSQTWIDMNIIVIDDIAIDLTYGRRSGTSRSIERLYKMAKELK